MKVAGGGFEQCYIAQAVVDTESLLILAAEVTQAANDKQQVEPMLVKLHALPEGCITRITSWAIPAISARRISKPATAPGLRP